MNACAERERNRKYFRPITCMGELQDLKCERETVSPRQQLWNYVQGIEATPVLELNEWRFYHKDGRIAYEKNHTAMLQVRQSSGIWKMLFINSQDFQLYFMRTRSRILSLTIQVCFKISVALGPLRVNWQRGGAKET